MNVSIIYRRGLIQCRKCFLLQNTATPYRRVLSSLPNPVSSTDPPHGGSGEGSQKSTKFAYGADEYAKRDRDAPGLFYLNTILIPKQLDENLKEYLKRYPRKIVQNDGLKLARHLRNRGRPTEVTWRKYKESKAAKKARDLKGTTADILKLKQEQDPPENSSVEYNIELDDTSDNEDITGSGVQSTDQKRSDGEEKGDAEEAAQKQNLKTKKPKREEYKVIRYEGRESTAFAASRIPSSYGTTFRVLHEIAKREPEYKPETLLDFGSGTGTALWAAHEKWGSSLKEYQCVEISEHMNTLAEFLLRGGDSYRRPLHIPHVYFKRFLPISNKVTYDVVVSSYSLSEIPHSSLRKEALKNLWAKTNDFLVIIEYGNNEGFETLLEARKMVETDAEEINIETHDADNESNHQSPTEDASPEQSEDHFTFDEPVMDKGYVFAPCPHDHTCARSEVETRDHPCNFEQRVQLSFVERFTGRKKWGYTTERFTYLVLRKGERNAEDKPWPRILEPVKLRGRHVICKLCTSNGNLEQKVLSKKKDSDIYKCVRHLSKWGDQIAIPEDRVRPLNNPHITVTRRGKQRT